MKPEVLAVTIAGRNIDEVVHYSVLQARDFFTALEERVPFAREPPADAAERQEATP